MLIAGLQKTSLIDFPGRLSCVLFLSGCNFDCPYCHNPGLVKEGCSLPGCINEEGLLAFLETRRGLLDGVVISGGEPTLHKDLMGLCEKIKAMGYPLKLDTNGSRPQVVKRLVDEGLVDYVAMDIKTDPYRYSPLIVRAPMPESILSSIRITMESAPAYEFRTTCVKPLVDASTVLKIVRLIKGAMLYALQGFNEVPVLHPEFFHGTDSVCSRDELMDLKALAEPWVERCIVR